MAKNMTRKGLGLGAALSVVAASLVVAAPAQASTVSLDPKTGTEYRIPISEDFTLKTRYGTGANVFNDYLEVIVSDADENLSGVTIGDEAATYNDDLGAWVGDIDEAGTVGTYYDVVLTPSTDDETFEVTVQTGFDLSATGVFGSTASPVRTVAFHVADDYTWNLAFDKPELGDTKLTATVTTTPALNISQLESVTKVAFGKANTDGTISDLSGNSWVSGDSVRFDDGASTTYSATDVDLSAEESESVTAAATYVAAVVLDGAQVSELAYQVVAAATVTTVSDAALTEGANVLETDTADTFSVRTGATALKWTATAEDADGDAVAGAVFTVTIEDVGTLSDDFSLVAGGKTLTKTTTGGKISFDVTADADGVATVAIALSGDEDAADSFTIDAKSQNVSATQVTVEFADTDAASLVDHNVMGTSGVVKVAKGGAYTLRFAALDNFGQPLTGDYRVLLTGGKAATDAAVVNGVATFNLTDDADTAEAYTATLQEYDKVNRRYNSISGSDFTTSITPVVGTSNAAAKITVTAADDGSTTAIALNTKDAKAANTRLGEVAPSATGGTTLSGQVSDANGVGTYSLVTLTLAGAQFKAATPDGKDVWTVGSIQVMTNASGAWSGVSVYSNAAGKVTVTAAAGSASEVEKVTFAAAAPTAGTSLVIDAPASVAPGSTVIATAMLTDKYGNPVAADEGRFAVAYDGPGLAVVTPSEYDADGEAKIAYFLGANDSGTITVTFSYSTADDDDFTGDDDLVVQKTIYIGAAPSAEVATWTKNLGDGTVKMYAKNIVGAGKVQFMLNGEEIAWVRAVDATDPKLRVANGFNYLVRTVELVEGQKNALEIYVDGERTTRTAYTY